MCQRWALDLSHWALSLAETSTPRLKLSRPKPPQTDERAWHNGLHDNKTLAYATVPLSEVECAFICIFLKFAFIFGLRCCMCLDMTNLCVCVFYPMAPLAECVSSVIPCPWATDQSSGADSLPAGEGLIKEPQTDLWLKHTSIQTKASLPNQGCLFVIQ